MKLTLSPLDKISIVIIGCLTLIPWQGFVYDLFMMKVFCFAIFAASLNLLLGFAGLLSFGHAAFFGTGAYITAYVMRSWGLTPELGLICGVLCSTALGYVFGALAIRRQGIYFAMITLALAQVVYFLATQVPFTNGEDGIQGVPRGHFLGLIDLSSSTHMYYFALAVFTLAFFTIKRIVSSPFGQVMKAIRENEPRAISLGYDVNKYKLIAFTLSAGLAGLGGGLKSLVLQLASLSDVFWHTSGEAVLMTILGGIGTLWGPVAGAAVIINLQNYLANLGGWSTIATGAIFVVCVLAFRRGIVGEIAYRLKIKL
ncbi:branched-chain amino acid ABC transporter permease [Polynucleobacter antarcticus]|uniref:Branched-chain amino acid ABC transporter permease n=1 Tax=Polynucleobacter antarcticus TaxID=1743162 RepID=A0A6M9PRV7_9BURK|nr:branched-chain amino acid ABC transporter permease [Polynucleobacter antarcticus]QKM62228.1 branched-chain amino acid ABC transporter permease [Polynucleobacter antarcticus]